jgi:hypothetical protein
MISAVVHAVVLEDARRVDVELIVVVIWVVFDLLVVGVPVVVAWVCRSVWLVVVVGVFTFAQVFAALVGAVFCRPFSI